MHVSFIKYIPLFELPVLILMVIVRAVILRRHGIRAFVFGVTDKSDFLIVPVILFLFYAFLAAVFDWPFPRFLKIIFWKNDTVIWPAIILCTLSLVWFAATLKTFGISFRVGIDTGTDNKLITGGTFAISRNPVYVGFISFFTGVFIAWPAVTALVFLVLFAAAIHRQVIREEKFLLKHYGQEYEDYCKKTRRYL